MALDKTLLDVLVCPKCKQKLELRDDEDALDCERCRLRFPIRNDIPVMLIEEALRLD